MDINLLSKLLKELLLQNDRVSLPGIGSFISEVAPSVFSDRALVIHPPYRRILFRTSEIWNDELLERYYASTHSISLEDSKSQIAEFVSKVKDELILKKVVKFHEFGTMKSTEQNDFFFVLEKSVFIYPDSFGLEPIHIKPLLNRGVVEKLTGKPQKIKNQKPIYSETVVSKKGKRGKFVLIAIIVFVLALAAGAYVFRKELRPLWEVILYSEDERKLLKMK